MQKLISGENETTFKSLRCYLNKNENHFLVSPKILPCSNLACSLCISQMKLNDILDCSFCNSQHIISNVQDLKSADNILDQITADQLTEEIQLKLGDLTSQLESNCSKLQIYYGI
jgi:hypothetical protein